MKNNWIKILAVGTLIAAIGAGIPVLSAEKKPVIKVKSGAVCPKPAPKAASAKPTAKKPAPKVSKALPRLLDLGASKCIPCKMMIPVLDDLRKEYKGQLKVDFIDVWKDRAASEKYKVQSIPTQIFFDAKGKEFFRHSGYFPKDEIVKTFKDHGIKLTK
jgi:thioredoxin 1